MDSDINADTTMRVSVKIELSEYRQIVFRQTYATPVFIIIHAICIALLIFYLPAGHFDWFMVFLLLFMLVLPLSVARSATSTYRSAKTLHENLVYEFTSETIVVTGESCNMNMPWRTLYKVKELGKWFLLYTNRQTAMVIPKRVFSSQSDLERFREFTRQVS